ncbi:MAG: DUF998 domain-containing protein [Candidatus Aenigmarchaeota archaeon]|nr:DUF998 domain-containing protein [Candidatus Aenigmarchaeota archaeon]
MSAHYAFGLAGILVAFSSILVSVVLSPSFNWNANAVSELGTGNASAIFNSGLVIAGALILIFSSELSKNIGSSPAGKLGVIFTMLSSASLALVGLFNGSYGSLHVLVSTSFFIFSWLSAFLMGIHFISGNLKFLGMLALFCAAGFAVVWLSGFPFALKEIISSASAAFWIAFAETSDS